MKVEPLLNGISYYREPDAFPCTTDSVALCAFAEHTGVNSKARVCDLGCGGGVIMLLLAGMHPEITLQGIEIDEDAYACARYNIEKNNLSDRLSVVHGDLKRAGELLGYGTFDVVVSNPPYFPISAGAVSPRMGGARSEINCDISDVCHAAFDLLKPGGSFFVVYRPNRVFNLLSSLECARLTPVRLQYGLHSENLPPAVVLVRADKGLSGALKELPPMLLSRLKL